MPKWRWSQGACDVNENWIVALVSPRDVAVHPNFREENVSDAPRILASRMKGWEFSLTNMREEPPLIGGDAGALLKAAEEAFHPETDINAAQVELERLASNSEDLALATVACLFRAASLADAEQYERLFRKLDAMI